MGAGMIDFGGLVARGFARITGAQIAANAPYPVTHTPAGALVDKDGIVIGPEAPYGPTVALTAAATGKRQAIGNARALSANSAGGGTIYYRFSDASGAVAVSASDATASLSATAVRIAVPSGMPYIEYLRSGGADVGFVLQPLV